MYMENMMLNNGVSIPALGFGVFRIPKGQNLVEIVADAVRCGYRHIDTAQGYWNEESVGEGIRRSGLDRKELFITTKVWMSEYGEEKTRCAVLESMQKLGVDYLNMVLLHQPVSDYYGAYRALETLYEEGRIKAIGVSNFTAQQITDLSLFSKVTPAVNQIGITPFAQAQDLVEAHQKYGVCLEAYAPFGNGDQDLLSDPTLIAIGRSHGKSSTQIILRWLYQRGIVSVAKTVHRERMKENLAIYDFTLTEEEMRKIRQIDRAKADVMDLKRAAVTEGLRDVIEREKSNVVHM